MRVTQMRVDVSTRITSAPRFASWSVQCGPAQTQVKSATRMPSAARDSCRALGFQRRDVDAERGQDFVGVLPERRAPAGGSSHGVARI
jgi:hypothetical protein